MIAYRVHQCRPIVGYPMVSFVVYPGITHPGIPHALDTHNNAEAERPSEGGSSLFGAKLELELIKNLFGPSSGHMMGENK